MIYRATVMHTPSNPFLGGQLETISDAGVLVRDGRIVALEDYASLVQKHQLDQTRDLRGGLLLPGFVDAHVHYPQVRVIGGHELHGEETRHQRRTRDAVRGR